MSTRGQKRRNNHRESSENVSETITSPDFVENVDLGDQDLVGAGPSSAQSPRNRNSFLEGLRASLKTIGTAET